MKSKIHLGQVQNRPTSTSLFKASMLLLTIPTLLSFVSIAHSYIIHLDAGASDECFHERAPTGVKLGFSFEVVEGGFYDVDVVIKDPNNMILHQEDRSSNGKFTVEANSDGPYSFCFSNLKSSQSPKFVIFTIDRSDTLKSANFAGDDSKPDEETKKIFDMVENLLLGTVSARHDVQFLTARDKVHRKINEATNSTIVWWSGVEFILLLMVTMGQVWYLKRFFEVRRKA